MNDHLLVYKANLHVLSPVFVGSGREISKKEYRLSPLEQKIVVYDPGKLYGYFKAIGKAALYENYLMSEKSISFDEWLGKTGVSIDDIKTSVRYSVPWGDRMELGKSKTTIMEFIKDPYGNPYIPGTSIKGMLRTMMLGYDISLNKGGYRRAAEMIKCLPTERPSNRAYSAEARMIECTAFNKLDKDSSNRSSAVNDVMQGLIISDSKPLDTSELVLCQKIEYHTNKEETSLNLLRECLRPGTDIEFTITIDRHNCQYDAELIMEAIRRFNSMYYECFLSKFGSKERPSDTVYIGGGVGFVSKTIIYPMFGPDEGVKMAQRVFRNTLNTHIFKEHGHSLDLKKGVSPHILKCTRYKGKRYQMGMCRFSMTKELSNE